MYRSFLASYYRANKDIRHESYDKQLKHILSQGFATADYYTENLKKLDVEAFELIRNAKFLQKKWAIENSTTKTGTALIIKQIKQLKPEVVFVQDSMHYNEEFVQELRSNVPEIKLIIGNLCSPFSQTHIKKFRSFDFFIACSPQFSNELTKNDIPNIILYHAFEPESLKKISSTDKNNELIFLGSIISGKGYHDSRTRLLEDLAKLGINFTIYGSIERIPPIDLKLRQAGFLMSETLKKVKLEKIASKLPGLRKTVVLDAMPRQVKISNRLSKIIKTPLFGYDMLNELAVSEIGLNIHGDVATYAANIRMFETTGVGTCLLTDKKTNINDLFIEDKEIVTYNSHEECVEKIEWLLRNPEKCREIALAGQKKCLKEHNYLNRMKELDAIIQKKLKQKTKNR